MGSRDEAIEAVRSRTDIVELIGRYLKLKKAGNRFVGLCPFHSEKTPSFSVNAQKGLYHCFGCKASGDAFSFLMRQEGKTFPEALEELAARAGVELPERHVGDHQARERRARLLEVVEHSAVFFENRLWSPEGAPARAYLQQRDVGEQVARDFRLGYAPSGWQGLTDELRRLGGSAVDEALDVGLLLNGNRGPYDLFRHRLVFPITGLDGKVHGFGARKLDPEEPGGKYINSSQSAVFDKSEVLYGLEQARTAIQQTGRAILVEGYFDVMLPAASGVGAVVATCGTSLTEGHARLLRRFCDRVVTVFDGDEPGQKAAFRAAEVLLGQDLSPYAVELPPEDDPDTFVRREGAEGFERLIETARPTIEVLAEAALRRTGTDVEARSRALHTLLPLVGATADPVRRGGYLRLLAERFRVDEADLRRSLATPDGSRVVRSSAQTAAPRRGHEPLPGDEMQCVSLLLQHPELAEQVRDSGELSVFSSQAVRALAEHLVADPAAAGSAAGVLATIEDETLRAQLAGQLVSGREVSPEQAPEAMSDCLRKIRAKRLRIEEQQLLSRIEEARQAGQTEEARRLTAARSSVARERAALGLAIKGSA